MTKRKFLLALAAFQIILILVMLAAPVWYARAVTASYNMTVRIVNSAGTVLDGVASAVTANYNQTVRVVDSNGNVIDAFSSPQPTPAGGYPLSQANGGTGQASLNAAAIGQTLNTQAGNPLSTANFTWGAESADLWTFTVRGNTMGPFDVLKCHAYGDYLNNTGGTISITWKNYLANKFQLDTINQTTGTGFRPWVNDWTIVGDGATNLNSFDGLFWTGGQAITGSGVAGSNLLAGYSASNIDMASDQVLKLKVIVGAATPADTPTSSPTSATTPIVRLFGAHCFRWPGITPTPSPTPTHTPTPAPTDTPAPTPT